MKQWESGTAPLPPPPPPPTTSPQEAQSTTHRLSENDFDLELFQNFVKGEQWPPSPLSPLSRKGVSPSVKSDGSPRSSSRNSLEEVLLHFSKSKQWPPSPMNSPLSNPIGSTKSEPKQANKCHDSNSNIDDEDDEFLVDMINFHLTPGPPPPPPPSPEKVKRLPALGAIRSDCRPGEIINTIGSQHLKSESGLIFFPTHINSNDLEDSNAYTVQRTVNALSRHQCKLQSRRITLNGKEIAVFKYKGMVHACDALCPHQGGPLHNGDIEEVSCGSWVGV